MTLRKKGDPMKSFLIICSIVFSQMLLARDIHVLNLEKSIAMAMELSYEMRILRENLQEAKFRLRAATNRFKTQVNFDMLVPMVSYQDIRCGMLVL
jgi:hypothetical protein